MSTHRRFFRFVSVFVIASMVFSGIELPSASAQGGDGVERQVNTQTGKVSFLSPESGQVLPASEALGKTARPQDPAMALAKRFGPEFGLQDPERELVAMEIDHQNDGRIIARYQQNFQGIPVMGGELIVNTNKNGDMYSMNGEMSSNLSLSTQPTINSERAKEIALQAAAKWYQKSPKDFLASEPALWIFDESLLRASTRPTELVWRLEVTPKEAGMPVRELVLVNAHRGGISLHFNRVDTAWMVSADATLDRTEKAMPAADPSNEGVTDNSSTDPMPALLGATWFVATTGNDSNSCSSAGSPCKTINGAIGKASTGDLIKVAVGTYTGTGTDVVLINKSVNLSGGWNAAFTAQSGISTIDAQKARRGVSVSAATSFERFIVTNGNAKAVNLNGLGGGVYILADVSVTFTNSSIQNNVAQVGGGIYKTIGSQSLTINNSTVVNNLALNGGGMEVDSSSLILNNSTVYNNSATAVGGGINIYNTTLTLNNSTISKNLASYIGGGIFAHTASMTVTNTTISKNSSTDSGGGIYIQAATGSNVSLKNSILGENFSQAAPDCAGALSSNGNNIISSTSGCTVTAATGDKFNISPGLGPFLVLQGYHPLLPSSPAINAGNSATCLSTDQRGVARVGICDIGAYEYTAPGPAASLSIVSGVGQRTPPKFAFIRAFQVVALDSQGSPVPNVNITFTAPGSGASGTFANTGNSTTSVLTGAGGIAVTSLFTANAQFGAYNVSVSASGLSPVNISLENAGWYVSPAGNDSNSCSVPGSPCETINAAINKALPEDTVVVGIGTYAGTDTFVVTIPMSLRLSGGWNTGFTNQTGASIIDGQHAREGVFVHGGVLTTATLERLAIVNGNVESSTGVEGGGIYNGAILTLNNVTVSNNFAYYGGGIYNSSYGILTLNNVTLSNNGAWLGGGLFNTAGTLTLKNTLVGNNSAGQGPDCIGAIDASTYSLISSEADCTVANGPGNLLNVQPRLGIFNFTEGYHSLVVGSPAIDAGNPAVPGSGGNACLLTDQRGVVRPVGVRCDIGAYEGAVAWTYRPLVSTHSAGNATSLPGAFICNQEDPNCSAGDFHAKAAHKYALGTYYLYAARHGRDSINNNGMTIISTVHYDTNYDNAFWNGNQMVYGDRYEFPLADDVVAHELTHGITQYESNLFYYYQSGAINESFSDLWGEFYDQTNSQGNDSSEVKWQMGEDVPDLGELRSLSDPPAYGDPDKMSSSFYYEGEEDNGGVHTNSGVSNKAVYLLVEGGLFNGKTVTALGWNKTAAIYYEVNTKLLSSGADYSDLYYALQQACTNLVGQQEITSSDCVEVRDAIDAVEMNGQPAPNFNTDAPLCPAESVPSMVSIDNLEAGTANWVFQNGALPRWQWDSPLGPYAQSGNHSLYADDSPDTITDASARWAARAIPNDAYLHFAHAYGFESGYNPGDPTFHHFDGGVLEYSINSGSTWVDAGALIDFNGYQGTLFTGAGNPLSGRSAFVGDSHGYISTRLNLAALAGKTVAFRWRMGLDEAAFDWGWWVDNVKLYICTPPPGAFNKTSPSNGGTGVGLSTILSWSSSSSATSYQYCYDIINDSQCNRTWIPVPSTSAGISNLGASTTYYWQVRAINGAGTTYADSQSWGSFTTTSILPAGLTEIETLVGTTKQGKYSLGSGQSLRESYTGVNNGPVKVVNIDDTLMTATERVIYRVNGVNTSFSEMMGLPNSQLDTIYWLPWYNNVDLDTQLRIANVSSSPATVNITIGGLPMGDPIQLAAGASTRVSFAGVNSGPVQIVSTQNIVAAERLIYKANGKNTSFSEMMALPNKALDTTYWLPWYNNVDLDTQLRFANVSNQTALVHVYIGGDEMEGSPFTLLAGESTRKSFAGVNNGPVKIVSDQNIVAAERLIYKVNGKSTSFTEMMALPNSQVDTVYWLPWYNNVDLDTQLRFANVHGTQTATVHIYVGGTEMSNSPFTLLPGESTRQSFGGINSGPVQIVSDVPIVAAERLIYRVNAINTSFSEMMALPNSQLDTEYWLPRYNNVDLDTQLRFGVP